MKPGIYCLRYYPESGDWAMNYEGTFTMLVMDKVFHCDGRIEGTKRIPEEYIITKEAPDPITAFAKGAKLIMKEMNNGNSNDT